LALKVLPEKAGQCDKPRAARHRSGGGDDTEAAMTLGTRLLTLFRGQLVGTDKFGNRYYRERGARALRQGGGRFSREKRWVIYSGEPEASKVPPEWHAWLHHTVDEIPRPDRPRHPWEKDHVPNMTGTPQAYYPPGSVLRGGRRAPSTGDYEPWTPE
jgi:NADH:ubiquinone oxidoreductase subunit